MEPETPVVFAIKRYALHDGPNIRTTIFFKGCPLGCHWCHNPEGIEREIRVITLAKKCVGSGECIKICPENALNLSKGIIYRDVELCSGCGRCVDICPALSHEAVGWETNTEQLMEEIKKDLPFFDQSGGGVTFSGGEPLMQPEFLLDLLQQCGTLEIHRTVDTSGFAPTEILLTIAEHTDLFLFDIKHMDDKKHRFFTGVSNERILHNLKTLSETGSHIRARIPLISSINDDEKNIRATGLFLTEIAPVQGVDILPHHNSGMAKYRKLDLKYLGSEMKCPEESRINRTVSILREYGLDVHLG
ncbi:MAG: glycyl-radical enzyme activating protein, partial [Deltaproteobacteria bacterium]|nr:glycyl-radical enzyme activating protein [Deltaproteobacteria bacterium]